MLAQIKNRYITDIRLGEGRDCPCSPITNCRLLMAMQDDPVVFICDISIALLSVTVITSPTYVCHRMLDRIGTFAGQLINFHSSCYKYNYKLISLSGSWNKCGFSCRRGRGEWCAGVSSKWPHINSPNFWRLFICICGLFYCNLLWSSTESNSFSGRAS